MSKSEQGAGRKPPTRTPEASRSAVVTTAIVEVKTLTLSGKQMTLAVFRQLPRAIPDDGVVGAPWGVVNYHPDAECKGLYEAEHLHVVSECDGQLVRTLVLDPSLRVEVFHSHDWRCSHRKGLHSGLRECFTPTSSGWDDLCDLPQLFIAV